MYRICRMTLACAAILSLTVQAGLAQDDPSESAGEGPAVLTVGDTAPDFELDTFDEKTVKLSERFGNDGNPVVLLFSRANW